MQNLDVRFIGYAPDVDPTTPGVIVDCTNIVPTFKGMKGAPSATASSLSALAAACKGAVSLTKLDGTTRVFAGTTTKLYEAGSGSWTDRTRASGGNYGLGVDQRWSFTQFGNVSLAAAKTDIIQSSTAGAFANVAANAPKAKIVEVVGTFVFAFDCNDQGGLADSADTPDRWWCSASSDQTDWTPDIATQCATGRLLSSPGAITAAKRFGNSVVVFKDRSMFLGTYAGPPEVWRFEEIPGASGAPSQDSVVNVGTPDNPRLIWMGYDDFYSFDGSRPVPLGTNRVKETVYGTLQRKRFGQTFAVHDRTNSLVYFFYCATDTVDPDKCVVYHYRADRWGRNDQTAQFAFEYIAPSLTYNDVGTLFTNYVDVNTITYGSLYWIQGFPSPAVFDSSNNLKTLSGTPTSSSITTGDLGDDVTFSCVNRVRPRYITKPSAMNLTNYYRSNLGDSLTTDTTTAESSGKVDILREGRWHRFLLEFTGAVEIPGMVVQLERAGDE